MKKQILIAVAITLVALAAWAASSDTILTAASPGMSLEGYTMVEVLADGAATIQLIDSSGPTVMSTHYLRDGSPRKFTWSFAYDGVDSLAVSAFTDATEVIATPK
jgi:hypothetical protein